MQDGISEVRVFAPGTPPPPFSTDEKDYEKMRKKICIAFERMREWVFGFLVETRFANDNAVNAIKVLLVDAISNFVIIFYSK